MEGRREERRRRSTRDTLASPLDCGRGVHALVVGRAEYVGGASGVGADGVVERFFFGVGVCGCVVVLEGDLEILIGSELEGLFFVVVARGLFVRRVIKFFCFGPSVDGRSRSGSGCAARAAVGDCIGGCSALFLPLAVACCLLFGMFG